MRYNKHELIALASQTSQNFDREGVFILKERQDGFFRKSEGCSVRWFRLRGNLLFYLKGPEPWYEPVGVIVLGHHQITVQSQDDNGHWPFQIDWENGVCYRLATFLESERTLWLTAIDSATYEKMTQQISYLTRQLNDIVSEIELHEYRENSKVIDDINDVPLCEMALACDNLVCDENGKPPSAFVCAHLLFPDKGLSVRYSATEIVEKCSNPVFTRTMMFRGCDRITPDTMVRFAVYNMREMISQTGVSLGSVTMRLGQVQGSQRLRVPLLAAYTKTMGFITINCWSVEPELATAPPYATTKRSSVDVTPKMAGHRRSQSLPSRLGLTLKYPSHSPVVRYHFVNPVLATYRFQTGLGGDVTVHEMIAEPRFALTIPQQLVKIYKKREEENVEALLCFAELTRVSSVQVLELTDSHLAAYRAYRSADCALNHYNAYFKASAKKENRDLAHFPTNLHLQRMWAHNDTLNKTGFHDVITVGAFTAHYMLNDKPGGLIKLLQQPKGSSSSNEAVMAFTNRQAAEFEKLTAMLEARNAIVLLLQKALLALISSQFNSKETLLQEIKASILRYFELWNPATVSEAFIDIGWDQTLFVIDPQKKMIELSKRVAFQVAELETESLLEEGAAALATQSASPVVHAKDAVGVLGEKGAVALLALKDAVDAAYATGVERAAAISLLKHAVYAAKTSGAERVAALLALKNAVDAAAVSSAENVAALLAMKNTVNADGAWGIESTAEQKDVADVTGIEGAASLLAQQDTADAADAACASAIESVVPLLTQKDTADAACASAIESAVSLLAQKDTTDAACASAIESAVSLLAHKVTADAADAVCTSVIECAVALLTQKETADATSASAIESAVSPLAQKDTADAASASAIESVVPLLAQKDAADATSALAVESAVSLLAQKDTADAACAPAIEGAVSLLAQKETADATSALAIESAVSLLAQKDTADAACAPAIEGAVSLLAQKETADATSPLAIESMASLLAQKKAACASAKKSAVAHLAQKNATEEACATAIANAASLLAQMDAADASGVESAAVLAVQKEVGEVVSAMGFDSVYLVLAEISDLTEPLPSSTPTARAALAEALAASYDEPSLNCVARTLVGLTMSALPQQQPHHNNKKDKKKGKKEKRECKSSQQQPQPAAPTPKLEERKNIPVFDSLTKSMENTAGALLGHFRQAFDAGRCTANGSKYCRVDVLLLVALLDEVLHWSRLAHTAVKVAQETPAVLRQKLLVQQRRDACFSQALSAVVAGLMSWLVTADAGLIHSLVVSGVGPLCGFEGLLSLYEQEKTMWGDMVVAIEDLHTVQFQLVRILSQGPDVIVLGSRNSLVVELPVCDTLYSRFESCTKMPTFTITAVFFNIGINEKAGVADTLHESRPQYQSNIDNLELLNKYYAKYCKLTLSNHPEQARASPWLSLQHVMESLRTAVMRRATKDVEVLRLAAAATRLMHGVRFTSCKSAKDRSAMSVTLEQTEILQREYQLADHSRQRSLDVMRSDGCRRINIKKNIDTNKFAFTKKQVMALPEMYRPPGGTYGSTFT